MHTAGSVSYNSTVFLVDDINTLRDDITLNSDVIRDTIVNVTLSTSGGPDNIMISGSVDADVTTRNLTLTTATAVAPDVITIGGAIGITGPFK